MVRFAWDQGLALPALGSTNITHNLGDGGEFAPPSPKKESRDLVNLKRRVETLEEENKVLDDRVKTIISENFESTDEQTRKIFEVTQAQNFEDRKRADEKIRHLEDQLENAREGIRRGSNLQFYLQIYVPVRNILKK